jgi:hypothetical protein
LLTTKHRRPSSPSEFRKDSPPMHFVSRNSPLGFNSEPILRRRRIE